MKLSKVIMVLCSIQATQSVDATDDTTPKVACSTNCCMTGMIMPGCNSDPDCISCSTAGGNSGTGSNTGDNTGNGPLGPQPLCYNCQSCLKQKELTTMTDA